MKTPPQTTQMAWTPWTMGHTIQTLMILGTIEGSINVPDNFVFTSPELHHVWDTTVRQLANVRPDWLAQSHEDHWRENPSPTYSVVCGTFNAVLLKIISWQKIHGYIVDGVHMRHGQPATALQLQDLYQKNRNIVAEYNGFLQAPNCGKVKLNLVNFLIHCHRPQLEYLAGAKGTIFDICDFLKDPYNYFVEFFARRGLTPNDKLEYYINLVAEANAPYMKDVLYAESFLPDIYNQVDRAIDISNYHEILIVAMISTSLNFDYSINKFTNTNQFLSRIR